MNSQDFQRRIRSLKLGIEKKLALLANNKELDSLCEPIRYVLSSGGKRTRGILVLLSCEAVGGRARAALNAAVAIELLHNFTLVHDDVMDNADVRRGQPAVHRKWDFNVAILVGDELIAQAYQSLSMNKGLNLKKILDVFTYTFIQVCEGQSRDKELENRRKVSLGEYLSMIEKKTARMIAGATEIGALIGGGSKQEVAALRHFGEFLGKAFQIQDDLLDIAGHENQLGKKIGGDVREGKKTYLSLRALERTKGRDRAFLQSLSERNRISDKAIARVREIYEEVGVLDAARKEIARNTHRAQASLVPLRSSKAKDTLVYLSNRLLERTS